MATKLKIYRGDTKKFKAVLKTLDQNTGLYMVYAIPAGAEIQVNLPGTTASVTITTLAGEVTIVDAANGVISCVVSSAKTPNLKIGDGQAIDAIITELSGDISTAEKLKVVQIVDRANP
jgi:hypothetical protein